MFCEWYIQPFSPDVRLHGVCRTLRKRPAACAPEDIKEATELKFVGLASSRAPATQQTRSCSCVQASESWSRPIRLSPGPKSFAIFRGQISLGSAGGIRASSSLQLQSMRVALRVLEDEIVFSGALQIDFFLACRIGGGGCSISSTRRSESTWKCCPKLTPMRTGPAHTAARWLPAAISTEKLPFLGLQERQSKKGQQLLDRIGDVSMLERAQDLNAAWWS